MHHRWRQEDRVSASINSVRNLIMARPIRVLIVEDQGLMAEGLVLALEREAGLRVIGVAQTVEDATNLAIKTRPHVALIDYYLPDGLGTQVVAVIRQQLPCTA